MITLFKTINIFFELLEILIIVRVFMNIFRVSLDNTIGRLIFQLTEPILAPAKLLLNKLGLDRWMIDFSPWVAIIFLRIIYGIIIGFFR